jgi:hypothetical protein
VDGTVDATRNQLAANVIPHGLGLEKQHDLERTSTFGPVAKQRSHSRNRFLLQKKRDIFPATIPPRLRDSLADDFPRPIRHTLRADTVIASFAVNLERSVGPLQIRVTGGTPHAMGLQFHGGILQRCG